MNTLRARIWLASAEAAISSDPSKSLYDRDDHAGRNQVERLFGRLNIDCRLSEHYEKSGRNSLNSVS